MQGNRNIQGKIGAHVKSGSGAVAVRANSKGIVPREVKKGLEYIANGIKWIIKFVK